MTMCGNGGKIDRWVLRVARDFESEREYVCVCVCVFFFFLRGRQTDKKIKRLDAKVIGLGEGKEKKNRGKKLD